MKVNNYSTKELEQLDAGLFEKALQLYIYFKFSIEQPGFPPQLKSRFSHNHHVVYSLIRTFLEENSFSTEYFEFLNEELKSIHGLNDDLKSRLPIKPLEINELELQPIVRLRFEDTDKGDVLEIIYELKNKLCRYLFRES